MQFTETTKEKNGTENLVFTSIEVDALIKMIGERVLSVMLGNDKFRDKFFENRDLLKTPINKLDMSVRLFKCLKRTGIKTLGDLVMYSENDLMKIRNFGKVSLTELKCLLLEYKLNLRGN
jgi:DNA-directed RNA polymerase subunit alpha